VTEDRATERPAMFCAYGFEADGAPRDGKPIEPVRLIEPYSTPPVEGSNYGDRGFIVARQNGVLIWAPEGSLRLDPATTEPKEPE
jgi:hypothetical protein